MHATFLIIKQKLEIKNLEITALSDTRWACRYTSVCAVKETYNAIVELLKSIANSNCKQRFEAAGLLKSIQSIEFIMCNSLCSDILSLVHVAHTKLPSENCTLGTGANTIHSLIYNLQEMRNSDTIWEKVLQCIASETETEVNPKRIRKPVDLDEFYVTSTCGQRPENPAHNKFDAYKTNLYYTVLNTMLAELRNRFSDASIQIARACDSVITCDPEGVSSLLDKYSDRLNIDRALAIAEMKIIRGMMQENPNKSLTLLLIKLIRTITKCSNLR